MSPRWLVRRLVIGLNHRAELPATRRRHSQIRHREPRGHFSARRQGPAHSRAPVANQLPHRGGRPPVPVAAAPVSEAVAHLSRSAPLLDGPGHGQPPVTPKGT